MMLNESDRELVRAATDIIQKNYDNVNWWHTVGAAVRTKKGEIYVGVNCDSVSHDSCAEYIAIGAAITAGEREFDTIVAVLGGEKPKILPPCGNCRQMLYSYDRTVDVIVDDETKENILELLRYPCD
ncbi:MAG: hypothetical protein ACRCW2_08215 [Cellulosilyticaceae bacterium]